ncbi:hypothetical protein KZZ52_27130 [Dactylosporangium sp. AC04546]|uniref:hypothetical protein n=1 Tax=Dactylosporangium sp. AC04546 TaxID=2862460 RepID=UPI001EDC9961|nr:hypothetical protein [Dactylosporangium sp. AC04546]WVK88940.1 hypothetical protein KZZ52_27130 [Dactylosporangium sp. AC04546]
MAVALDDILLVLLGRRDASAYDLWHRHIAILGAGRRVDIVRVMAAVSRLERGGLLRVEPPQEVRKESWNRRRCQLTPAGRRRQAAWLCAISSDIDADDMYVRGILAVEAADQATFTAFLENAQVAIRSRQRQLAELERGAGSAVEQASIGFNQEVTRALLLWLHQLPDHHSA